MAALLLGLAALATAACGSGGNKAATNSAQPSGQTTQAAQVRGATPAAAGAGGLQPVVASSELVVGQNRFTMGILDRGGTPIPDAKVHFKFFQLQGAPNASGAAQGVLKSEADATFRSPGREAGLPAVEQVKRPDGSTITIQSGGDEVGVYEATVSFDQPGNWGVEADVTGPSPDKSGVVRTPVKVLTQSVTPAVGSKAIPSKNLTWNDVSDHSIIDTSAKPAPDMHSETIADGLAAGHPLLVLFATPGYCTSRLCGPELELARKLEPKYQGKADFIHVEIYQDHEKGTLMPAVQEWHLQSEPWFFIVDGKGTITAKFEGPTTMEELDQALQKATS
jgi:hypothetical protein